jgi:hypothetical protein
MRKTATYLALALAAAAVPAAPAAQAADDPSRLGVFGTPFEEAGPKCVKDAEGRSVCKPAAVSTVALPDGTVLYWDGLEGMEDVDVNTVAQIGHTAQDDQSRILDLRTGRPRWATPTPERAGDGGGVGDEYLPVVPHNNDNTENDNDLFCSGQLHLADGRVLNVGGTGYYLEPGVPGVPYGLSELEGLKATRIYDTATRTWRPAKQNMTYGRWYPSLVTLPDGKVVVMSGVTKLIKPGYPDRPTDSGTNVKQVEVFDPETERWSVAPKSADRSLPLYPRLHLLPNGKVYYDASGQTFNPVGQSYDEALWNTAAVFDPKAQTWRDLGLPAFGPVLKGFRGSAFSQQLTLKAPYTKAEFLSAGGVYGVSPGTYVASDTSTLNTVDVSGGTETFTTEATGPMTTPRWYSTGVTLPTGQVLAFSGADRDEVVGPGSGTPVTRAEWYDPATKKWTALATAHKGRTYHNTATLLPDGRVLVGGHAPINTGYAVPFNEGRTAAGLSDAFRDPSFEVYSPPNLFYGPRPVITDYALSQAYGTTTDIEVKGGADDVASVVLVRNPALTHLVDGDQKVVELPVVGRRGDTITVATPPSADIAPAGPYWLFVNKRTAKGLTPSVSRQVYVGTMAPFALRPVIERNNERAVREERAQHTPRRGDPRPDRGRDSGRPQLAGAAVPATVPAAPDLPVPADRVLAARDAAAARPRGPVPAAALLVLTVTALLVRRQAARR